MSSFQPLQQKDWDNSNNNPEDKHGCNTGEGGVVGVEKAQSNSDSTDHPSIH